MRLFLSINVPDELHEYCRQVQSRFPGMKNVEEFHLTLQFLGDGISEAEVGRIVDALSKIRFEPFEIKLGEARPFPTADRPNGIWVDCDGGTPLNKLAEDIRRAMERIGYKPDKPFAAHITLGRYKKPPFQTSRPRDFRQGGRPQASALTKKGIRSFTVDRFYLMESRLKPGGSEYKELAFLGKKTQLIFTISRTS